MSDFTEGWLREQIAKSAALLDCLPPEVRDALAHRTHADRETIARALVRDAYVSSIDDARDIADEVVDLSGAALMPDRCTDPTCLDHWPEIRPRLLSCVEQWPGCVEGDYNPACCRFPKSCSCTVFNDGVDPVLLERSLVLPHVLYQDRLGVTTDE